MFTGPLPVDMEDEEGGADSLDDLVGAQAAAGSVGTFGGRSGGGGWSGDRGGGRGSGHDPLDGPWDSGGGLGRLRGTLTVLGVFGNTFVPDPAPGTMPCL